MFKKIIYNVSTIVIIIVLFFYIKGNINDFLIIKSISSGYICILLLIELFSLLLQGYVLKALVKCFDIDLSFKEWFGLTVLTNVGNYIFPIGGFGFRAAYLKKVHNFNYTYFVSTLSAIYIIQFMIFSLGGLIGIWAISPHFKNLNYMLIVFLSTIFLFSAFLALFSTKLPRFKSKFLIKFENVIEGWQKMKQSPVFLRIIFFSTLAQFLLGSATFLFAYGSLGVQVSYLKAFLPTSLSAFAIIFRITPGSLGFYEGIVIYATRLLNITGPTGLIVAAITRCITLFWMIILGPIFGYIFIFHKQKDRNLQKND